MEEEAKWKKRKRSNRRKQTKKKMLIPGNIPSRQHHHSDAVAMHCCDPHSLLLSFASTADNFGSHEPVVAIQLPVPWVLEIFRSVHHPKTCLDKIFLLPASLSISAKKGNHHPNNGIAIAWTIHNKINNKRNI